LKERPQGLAYSLYAENGSTRPAGYLTVSNTDLFVNGAAALPLNTWTHVAITYDGTTLRMFINGVQTASKVLGGSITVSTGALQIGGNTVWGEYFKGLIDEVRIYNRALTSAEIQLDMAAPVQ
jgi:hydrogenase maturation factor HypE